jgi:hypothetical protein
MYVPGSGSESTLQQKNQKLKQTSKKQKKNKKKIVKLVIAKRFFNLIQYC